MDGNGAEEWDVASSDLGVSDGGGGDVDGRDGAPLLSGLKCGSHVVASSAMASLQWTAGEELQPDPSTTSSSAGPIHNKPWGAADLSSLLLLPGKLGSDWQL